MGLEIFHGGMQPGLEDPTDRVPCPHSPPTLLSPARWSNIIRSQRAREPLLYSRWIRLQEAKAGTSGGAIESHCEIGKQVDGSQS